MPDYDLHEAMLAAALEERLRLRMTLEAALAVSPDTLMAQVGLDSARARAKREAQLRWLRASLERDMAPPWLIEMVLARWEYVPDREWE